PTPLPRRLTVLDLVTRGWPDVLARVVFVEAQGDVLAPGLGLDVLDRIAVTLPDVGLEGVAMLILGRRVPDLSLRQGFLPDVLLHARAREGVRIDARGALDRHPLGGGRRQAVVGAVERDLLDRERLAADGGLEFESSCRLGLVDQGAV